jgi:hypothetical protein
MNIFIFGNGNISFEDFLVYYINPTNKILKLHTPSFTICDFRGTDTLMMEFLKFQTPNVTLLHIGDKPRYLPDKYKTKVNNWQLVGQFTSDEQRDTFGINSCTHFLAHDFNSTHQRKSGTSVNIDSCNSKGKISIYDLL